VNVVLSVEVHLDVVVVGAAHPPGIYFHRSIVVQQLTVRERNSLRECRFF